MARSSQYSLHTQQLLQSDASRQTKVSSLIRRYLNLSNRNSQDSAVRGIECKYEPEYAMEGLLTYCCTSESPVRALASPSAAQGAAGSLPDRASRWTEPATSTTATRLQQYESKHKSQPPKSAHEFHLHVFKLADISNLQGLMKKAAQKLEVAC